MNRHLYADLDRPWIDYQMWAPPSVPGKLFRGPPIDLTKRYMACLGAAQTFGRFCHEPYPTIVARRLGIQALNLGAGGAGPRFFLNEGLLGLANGASLAIIQVLPARSEGNSWFDTSRTGTMRGMRISDRKKMRFEDWLREFVRSETPAAVEQAIRETREGYCAHMQQLLRSITVPKVLLYFSDRAPAYTCDYTTLYGILRSPPQLVDDTVVSRLIPFADAYVECASPPDGPQRLWTADHPIDGAKLIDGCLFNTYYPTPEMHVEAADALERACRGMVRSPEGRSA